MGPLTTALVLLLTTAGLAVIGFLVAASVIFLSHKCGAREEREAVLGLVILVGLGLFAGANAHYLPAWAGLLGGVLFSPLFCLIVAVGFWLPAKALWHAAASIRSCWWPKRPFHRRPAVRAEGD